MCSKRCTGVEQEVFSGSIQEIPDDGKIIEDSVQQLWRDSCHSQHHWGNSVENIQQKHSIWLLRKYNIDCRKYSAVSWSGRLAHFLNFSQTNSEQPWKILPLLKKPGNFAWNKLFTSKERFWSSCSKSERILNFQGNQQSIRELKYFGHQK